MAGRAKVRAFVDSNVIFSGYCDIVSCRSQVLYDLFSRYLNGFDRPLFKQVLEGHPRLQ
jgi:hypothetical protein